MAMNKAKELVSTNSVVVFSKDILSILRQSEGASESTRSQIHCCGIGYRELNIQDGSEIQSALLEWTGQRTVPNVFHRLATTSAAVTKPQACTRKESWFLCLLMLELLPLPLPLLLLLFLLLLKGGFSYVL
ncbi:hypothetical protein NC651_004657 [Populus alba x Populus x berolinensis]|nr:hypothetical protein NC651_004657 [Populus alba x Populus x berolinensis]